MNEFAIKYAVRDRDGNCCIECGMTSEEHYQRYGKNLDVHRLVPGSVYTVEGCVTLCRSCHGPKPKSPKGKSNRYGQCGYVGIPLPLYETLQAIGAAEDRSASYIARRLIKEGLERQGKLPK